MSICSINRLENRVLVRISSPRNITNLRLTGVFVLFFGVFGIYIVMDGICHPPVSPGIVPIAILFGLPLLGLLWNVGGEQTILVDGNRLTLRWSFLGIACWRNYDAELISRLRPVKDGNFGLAFDVVGRTVLAGQGVGSHDAQRIVARSGAFQSSFLDDTRS